jgi:hypothetical protein
MLNVDSFITKEGDTFYFDLDSYNKESEITIDNGDTIKFNCDGIRYTGKVVNKGGGRLGIFQIENTKKI